MRHSFLPIPEQTQLKRSYRVHVAVVALFLISVAVLIGLGSLFPSFIAAYSEEHIQLDTVATLKENKDTTESTRIQKELQADSAKITALAQVATVVRPSAVIARVVEVRGPVRISSIAINELSTTTAVLVMQGVAPTREALVSFKTRLEGLSPGNKVELPISGFAKSKDLPFSIRVTHLLP
jgi:hypothetical protein